MENQKDKINEDEMHIWGYTGVYFARAIPKPEAGGLGFRVWGVRV